MDHMFHMDLEDLDHMDLAAHTDLEDQDHMDLEDQVQMDLAVHMDLEELIYDHRECQDLKDQGQKEEMKDQNH